jgi:predicted ATP-dependent Lon-type protease
MNNYLDNIIEEIKKIETENLKEFDECEQIKVEITQKTKVYFWIRVYLKEEIDIKSGDKVIINWNIYDEKIETQFLAFGKKGLDKDHLEQITYGNLEDDKKILSLMVDSDIVNYSKEIPHLRKLFKLSHHYQEEIIRHNELDFLSNGEKLEYYDLDI